MEQEQVFDINEIINDENLKPYFLDVVGKIFLKNLYGSHHPRFQSRLKAQKEFYDSLSILTEKLMFVVPVEQMQATIVEVFKHYMETLKPILRKEDLISYR